MEQELVICWHSLRFEVQLWTLPYISVAGIWWWMRRKGVCVRCNLWSLLLFRKELPLPLLNTHIDLLCTLTIIYLLLCIYTRSPLIVGFAGLTLGLWPSCRHVVLTEWMREWVVITCTLPLSCMGSNRWIREWKDWVWGEKKVPKMTLKF